MNLPYCEALARVEAISKTSFSPSGTSSEFTVCILLVWSSQVSHSCCRLPISDRLAWNSRILVFSFLVLKLKAQTTMPSPSTLYFETGALTESTVHRLT